MNPMLWSRTSGSLLSGSFATSAPLIQTSPAVGRRMHPMIERSVVLPLPDGPLRSITSPRGTSRSAPFNAKLRLSYVLVTPRTAIADCMTPPFFSSAFKNHGGIDPRNFVDGNKRRGNAHEERHGEHAGRHRRVKSNDGAASLGVVNEYDAYQHPQDVSDDGAERSLVDDDAINKAVRRAHRLQRAILFQVIHRGGIDRLRDNDDSHDEAHCSCDQDSGPRAGGEHPVKLGHSCELGT